jgi:asparagine synthase (glutamine-hydrolysing)
MSEEDAVDGARERLFESVRVRMRADVPVAFCLSGGVDSSALASIAAKHCGRQIHTFSIIDQDVRYNETENIDATARELGSDHHVIQTSTMGFLDRLAAQVDYHDGPVSTISYYIHGFLSQAIADAGFKVAISGTAADELFTGYYDHYSFWLAEMRESTEIDSLLTDWGDSYGAHVRNPFLQDPLQFAKTPDERRHIYLNRELFNSLMHEPFEEDFFEADLSPSLLRGRMLNELFHEAIPVLLREDDLNSMSVSIENRSPYLDRHLSEFMYSVPSRYLIKDGYAKWILREAVDGVLNDQVRLDKQKRGFNASIDSLLDRSDSDVIDRLLAPGPIFDIVKRDRIEAFLREDFEDNSFSKFAFSFVSAKLFLESDLVSGQHSKVAA